MEQLSYAKRLEEKCRQLGLAPTVVDQLKSCLLSAPTTQDPAQELEKLRLRESEIVQLLGAAGPDRILHDLRNVINELQLLKAAMELEDEA